MRAELFWKLPSKSKGGLARGPVDDGRLATIVATKPMQSPKVFLPVLPRSQHKATLRAHDCLLD